jgi:high-affinity Fe2+/Pb2+ permease
MERETMNEIFPIMGGLVIGALLGWVRPAMQRWVGVVLAVAFGVLATVISGESHISWGFLLIDIPLVAVSALLGLMLVHRLRKQTGR